MCYVNLNHSRIAGEHPCPIPHYWLAQQVSSSYNGVPSNLALMNESLFVLSFVKINWQAFFRSTWHLAALLLRTQIIAISPFQTGTFWKETALVGMCMPVKHYYAFCNVIAVCHHLYRVIIGGKHRYGNKPIINLNNNQFVKVFVLTFKPVWWR